ncbi:MAG: polymorphic toxin-type HINT domain-containing protein, partial [Granulosicoccus sp.]
GQELAESALLGGISKLGGALKDAAQYASDGAWTLWKKLKERFGRDSTNGGICSFAGDTLVVTDSGYKPIKDIVSQQDKVWARDEYTGKMGWRDVLAQYSNRYEETVHVTAMDGHGKRQTITSNRIHPYFARLAAGAILATASVTTSPVMAGEGHVYSGEIAGGAWVDAQHLQPGDELLTQNNQWQMVEAVVVESMPLDAYNLSVDEYATYFVSAEEGADAVWVHNVCYNGLPKGFTDTGRTTDYNQPIYVDKNGREIYQGHHPNANRYYELGAHPPTPPTPAGSKIDTFAHAADFGIKPYKDLKKQTAGTGLEAHHLIEQRFADELGVNPNTMPAIALTKAEHRRFTNAWRDRIPYGDGTRTATREQILAEARDIYKNYPEILAALGL